MQKHSNISPAVKLAKQLYEEDGNRVKPTWDQLVSHGATQSMWIERAEKLMTLQVV
jgi:hypothetical protein